LDTASSTQAGVSATQRLCPRCEHSFASQHHTLYPVKSPVHVLCAANWLSDNASQEYNELRIASDPSYRKCDQCGRLITHGRLSNGKPWPMVMDQNIQAKMWCGTIGLFAKTLHGRGDMPYHGLHVCRKYALAPV
jgi:hypothetical protein